jgi:hypothetical protein
MVATGRPGDRNVSVPSGRTTMSLSPRMLTCSPTDSGSSMVTSSEPLGATAFTPPGPAPPAMRSKRSFSVLNSDWTTARSINVLSRVSTPTVAMYFR